MEHKTCSRCHQSLATSCFGADRGGLRSMCKSCVSARNAANYASRKEAQLAAPHQKTCIACAKTLPIGMFTRHAAQADGFKNKCRQCVKAYDAQRWLEADRKASYERVNAWRAANLERARELQQRGEVKRRGDEDRLVYMNAFTAERRAHRRRATPLWADREAIRQAYEVAAVLSRGGVKFHVDHDIPLLGRRVSGLHVETNLVVLPAHVNLAKSNRFEVS